MVCVLDERSALCIVQDKIPTGSEQCIQFNLSVTSTVEDLVSEVQKHFSYDPDSYELLFTRSGEDVKKKNMSCPAADVGVQFGADSRNNFVIIESSKRPKVYSASSTPSIVISYANQSGEKDTNYESMDKQEGSKSRQSSYRYVGLVNQAMTCYLNSLIQALYMTPEFRNALYKWEFVGSQDETKKSIPYQLQRLFVSLQTSERSAVETTNLTRSFGWDSSDSWQQHDIQELCRVMFDALEQRFQNTDQADFINKLYEGKMLDYVKCLECGTEKTREDTFLDIPLPVRPFGSNLAYNSVEEAMMAFVQPETLDGNNQYFCEKCDKKCNAHKGLKFSRFPYVLTLHLKRFDFDYSNMQRIKLTDRVEFPEYLNINKFISQSSESNSKNSMEPKHTSDSKNDEMSVTDVGLLLEDEGCQSTDAPENMHGSTSGSNSSGSNVDIQDYDEGIDVSNGVSNHQQEKYRNHRQTDVADPPGPYIYELFSIMIHSGSASGGHYYAYIKDFNKGEWFCFNDQSVNKITYEDIYKTYGGGVNRTYFLGAHSSSTSAYMLMYRQVDKERNAAAMPMDEFPPHLQELVKSLQEDEEEERKTREREKDRLEIKVYARHPKDGRLHEKKLWFPSTATLADVTSVAHTYFSIDDIFPIDQCRLVSYNSVQETIEFSFDNEDDELIKNLLSRSGNSSQQRCLLLETREANAQFETYQLGGVVLKVYRVHMDSGEVDSSLDVPAKPSTTVSELRPLLARAVKLSLNFRIMMEKYGSSPITLNDDNQTLESAGFFTNNKIFVATVPENALDADFDSAMSKIVERFGNTITLYCHLPRCDRESLAKLGIMPISIDGGRARNGESDNGDGNTDTPSQLPVGDGEEEGPGATGCSDQSTSEDSSLTDSDRTIVGYEADYCLAELSSSSNSPHGSDQPDLSSPDDDDGRQKDGDTWSAYGKTSRVDSTAYLTSNEDEVWKQSVEPNSTAYQYLRILPCENEDYQDYHGSHFEVVRVQVDKRLGSFHLKVALAQRLGVSSEYIKLFRKCNGAEMEHKVKGQLNAFHDTEHLFVRLERSLRKGEYRGKVYLFSTECEMATYLCDWILTKDMLVGEAKKNILEELRSKGQLDIPHEKCRLRAKKWKDPGKIFLDSQSFQDLQFNANWEMFLQELPEGETVTSPSQITVLLRRVLTSVDKMDEFHEITLQSPSYPELLERVSQFSGIPPESLHFARPTGNFPHTKLTSHELLNDLKWDVTCKCNLEDGTVLFYRNMNDEPLQHYRTRERRNVRRDRTRQERVLKIRPHQQPQEEASTPGSDGLSSGFTTFTPSEQRGLRIAGNAQPPP